VVGEDSVDEEVGIRWDPAGWKVSGTGAGTVFIAQISRLSLGQSKPSKALIS
jgi:hypothetical protein